MSIVKFAPMDVARGFIGQYYLILRKHPDDLYKFYQESSALGWPEADGDITPVTTLNGIRDKINASEHKYGTVEIKTIDAQDTLRDAILVTVTGLIIAKDGVKKYLIQTFVLVTQETGLFVLNDILRILDVPKPITTADENNGATSYPPAMTSKQNSVNENTEVKVVQTPIAVPHTVSPLSSDVKTGSPLAPVPKVTYASVAAKVATPSTPKINVVTSNVHNETKPSTPATSAAKVSIPSDAALKGSASSPKATPKSPRAGSSTPNYSTSGKAGKGVYIGQLPYEITKQGIVDVVKQFGQVKRKPGSIKIKRHEDGFCCGFVEFESVDAARLAVEAHHVQFGNTDKLSYILYKRSNQGNDGRRQFPTVQKGRFQNENQGSGQSMLASPSRDAAPLAVEAHHVQFDDTDGWSYVINKRSNRGNDGGRGSPMDREERFQNGKSGSGQSRPASREAARAKN